ncbi:hypothetical protein GW17_00012445 [Ensete ventricosum]|nr:hypothetical protein GW17_00012445 [Ensete ventricosum]
MSKWITFVFIAFLLYLCLCAMQGDQCRWIRRRPAFRYCFGRRRLSLGFGAFGLTCSVSWLPQGVEEEEMADEAFGQGKAHCQELQRVCRLGRLIARHPTKERLLNKSWEESVGSEASLSEDKEHESDIARRSAKERLLAKSCEESVGSRGLASMSEDKEQEIDIARHPTKERLLAKRSEESVGSEASLSEDKEQESDVARRSAKERLLAKSCEESVGSGGLASMFEDKEHKSDVARRPTKE